MAHRSVQAQLRLSPSGQAHQLLAIQSIDVYGFLSSDEGSIESLRIRLLREMNRKHRIKDRVDRALGVVKAFSIAVPAGMQLKLDVEAATGIADSGDPEQDLSDLVREIGEVARITGAGALFLIGTVRVRLARRTVSDESEPVIEPSQAMHLGSNPMDMGRASGVREPASQGTRPTAASTRTGSL